MQLSKNFSLNEFIDSPTAKARGISNEPTPEVLEALKALVEHLMQPLRDKLGKGIRITSGYRSPLLNSAVGSTAKKSQHTQGEACDFVVTGMTPYEVCQYILTTDLEFDQLIYEGTWVHISYSRTKNKKQVLTAIFNGGIARYVSGLQK